MDMYLVNTECVFNDNNLNSSARVGRHVEIIRVGILSVKILIDLLLTEILLDSYLCQN